MLANGKLDRWSTPWKILYDVKISDSKVQAYQHPFSGAGKDSTLGEYLQNM
jgi:hypothetical protein